MVHGAVAVRARLLPVDLVPGERGAQMLASSRRRRLRRRLQLRSVKVCDDNGTFIQILAVFVGACTRHCLPDLVSRCVIRVSIPSSLILLSFTIIGLF